MTLARAARTARATARLNARPICTAVLNVFLGLIFGFMLAHNMSPSTAPSSAVSSTTASTTASTTSSFASFGDPFRKYLAPQPALPASDRPSYPPMSVCDIPAEDLPSEMPYDLPTALDVPLFLPNTPSTNWSSFTSRLSQLSCVHPHSLAHHYYSIPSVCLRQPFVPHLRAAIEHYSSKLPPSIYHTIANTPATLTLHLPSTTNSLSAPLADALSNLTEQHNILLLLVSSAKPALSPTSPAPAIDNDVARIKQLLLDLLEPLHQHVELVVQPPTNSSDDLLATCAKARHLLLDSGPLSALAALTTPHSVYFTPGMHPYVKEAAFFFSVEHPTDLLPIDNPREPKIPPQIHLFRQQLDVVAKMEHTCCQNVHIGKGDGEKIICGNMPSLREPDCWVLSIGSQGNFVFEEYAVQNWECKVATFDCTGNWLVPDHLKSHVTLTKLCVSTPTDPRELYVSLQTLVEKGSQLAGFEDGRMPALVKIDVEGWEFAVFDDVLENMPQHLLPKQIVMEIHLMAPIKVDYLYDDIGTGYHKSRMQLDKSVALMHNFARRGYVVTHREDNWFDAACTEVTLMLNESLPAVSP